MRRSRSKSLLEKLHLPGCDVGDRDAGTLHACPYPRATGKTDRKGERPQTKGFPPHGFPPFSGVAIFCPLDIVASTEKVTFRCSTHFFDTSKARFTANSKLALRAQTLNLRPFRFAKTCYRKNLNSRSKRLFSVFQQPVRILLLSDVFNKPAG